MIGFRFITNTNRISTTITTNVKVVGWNSGCN